MDPETHVPLPRRTWFSRMQAHPHADLDAMLPGLVGEGPLGLYRARDRISRARERDEERVTLRVDLSATMRLEALTQDPLVNGECDLVPAAELLQKLRRAFDIGEQERDSAGRQLDHLFALCPQLSGQILSRSAHMALYMRAG